MALALSVKMVNGSVDRPIMSVVLVAVVVPVAVGEKVVLEDKAVDLLLRYSMFAPAHVQHFP